MLALEENATNGLGLKEEKAVPYLTHDAVRTRKVTCSRAHHTRCA